MEHKIPEAVRELLTEFNENNPTSIKDSMLLDDVADQFAREVAVENHRVEGGFTEDMNKIVRLWTLGIAVGIFLSEKSKAKYIGRKAGKDNEARGSDGTSGNCLGKDVEPAADQVIEWLDDPKEIRSIDNLEFKIKQILAVTFLCESRGLHGDRDRLSIEEADRIYRNTPTVFFYINKQRDYIMRAVREFLKHRQAGEKTVTIENPG